MVALGAVVPIGVFFIVPWDLPTNASLVYHIVARLLEFCYVGPAIAFGILLIDEIFIGSSLYKFTDKFEDKFNINDESNYSGCFIGLMGLALGGQIFFFPLVVTFFGLLGLIGLLVLAAIIIYIDIRISV